MPASTRPQINIDYVCMYMYAYMYGVATTSRLLKIICLFCKRGLQMRQYSAKETYNFKEPTNRSHPYAYVYVFVL